VLLSGVAISYEAIIEIDPPPSLQAIHDNLVEVFGLLADEKQAILDTAAAADTFASFEEVIAEMPDIADGCQPIGDEAFFLGVEIELFC
jgi:hypothetical protein